MQTPIIIGLLILSTLTFASCSDTKTNTQTPISTPVATTPTKTPDTLVGMDHGSMDMSTMTGEMAHMGAASEEEFIVNMLPHHQEAIDTAKIIIATTENAELKQIAQAIIDDQSTEIITMRWWLANWYPNTTLKTEYMSMMRDLTKLSVHERDDAFMDDMIKHHEWAVHMAEEVLGVSQRPEIVKMANDIIRTQNAEIATFKKILGNH